MEVPFKQVGKTKEQGKEGGEREARLRKKLGNSKKERTIHGYQQAEGFFRKRDVNEMQSSYLYSPFKGMVRISTLFYKVRPSHVRLVKLTL